MRRTFKFRMYETPRNKRLHRVLSAAGRIWNHCVAFQRTYYRLFRKYCSKAAMQRHVAKLRKRRPDWQAVGSQAVQKVIERLDNSYQRFFKWAKTRKGPKVGRPGFKKSREYSSITMTQAGWKLLDGNRIRIGQHNYKFVKSRGIEGTIKTVTVKRDRLGRLWLCFSTLVENFQPARPLTSNVGGFDFGLKDFLTADDGSTIRSPEFFRTTLAALARAGRRLATKQKGSNNRRKARLALSRVHERTVNRRRDWFFKLAHDLCDRYSVLCFEDLNLDGMKSLWGRKISDLSFDSFLQILQHVATKRGCRVVQVGRFEPTTKTCSQCGQSQAMPLDVRTFDCGSCGFSCQRDVNAAINIKRLGHQADGLGDVRLGLARAIPV